MNRALSPYLYAFTVFTPTFNRAHTLLRVYQSLREQVFRDFEWLVVDDGSTDETRTLVEAWQREAAFTIRYRWQRHRGKQAAANLAAAEAHGELLLPLDSDDACPPDALAVFKHIWEAIPEDSKHRFSGVTALCVDRHGRLIGSEFPTDVTDSTSLEIRYKYKVKGDKWGFHRTDILRTFPFPVIDGSTFTPEGIVWTAIGRSYKTRYINRRLKIVEYVSDGLTRSRDPSAHAPGHALWHQTILNDHIDWLFHAPTTFLRSAVHYARFSLHCRRTLSDQLGRLTNAVATAMWVAMLPAGYVVFWNDRRASRHGAHRGT